MPTLQDIITEKLDRLDAVPAKLINSVQKSQKRIFETLLKELDTFERVDGKIVLSNDNFVKIEGIANKLKDTLFETEYLKAVQSFASEFPAQSKLTNQYFEKVFSDVFQEKELFKSIIKASQRNAIELLSEGAINKEFIIPVKDILSRSVVEGQSFSDAIKTLTEAVQGKGEGIGLLEQYVKQVAKDSFTFADAQYLQVVSEDVEAEWFVYRGGIIQGTRPFCKEFNGQYFHKREIEDLGSGKDIDGSKLTSEELQGRIPGTDAGNIFTNRGGFNCNHLWMPVSISSVPGPVIKRNIEKGYYNSNQ